MFGPAVHSSSQGQSVTTLLYEGAPCLKDLGADSQLCIFALVVGVAVLVEALVLHAVVLLVFTGHSFRSANRSLAVLRLASPTVPLIQLVP